MIQITPQMRILLSTKPVDFRKGIDGLAGLCRRVLNHNPFSGCLFVFCNRSRRSIKILVYDGNGFWLCQKRLSQGRLKWWPSDDSANVREIHAQILQVLVWNGVPNEVQFSSQWRRIPCREIETAA